MYQLEVAPGVTFVEGERRGRFPYGDVLVLEGREARVLVDTGAGEEVLAGVLDRGPVDVVINTHYHIDHVRGNVLAASRSPGAAFWCPEGEKEPLTSWEGFLRFTGFDDPGLDDARRFRSGLGWAPTPVVRELVDGEVLDFGGLRATVLRLSGHTPGHTGLWFEERQVLFTADIDMSSFGPWYGDVFSSIDDYLASLERLERLAAGTSGPRVVLTSHRRPLTVESFRARLPAFRARFEEREERILSMLAGVGPLTLEDLAARWPIYGRQSRVLPGLMKSERLMLAHHLERLARSGRVRCVAGPGGEKVWEAL